MDGAWVFLGGGSGAVLRWIVSGWWPAPWGTMVVNVLGSACLAALMHPSMGLGGGWRLGLGTGLMGGFTTYSTFNLDVLTALQDGDPGRAAWTAGLTMGGCLLGAATGWWIVGSVSGG
jgi:CrcB protein